MSLRAFSTRLLRHGSTTLSQRTSRPALHVGLRRACPEVASCHHQQYSTTSAVSSSWFSGWTDERNRKQFVEQMQDMAKVEHFTLGSYYDALAKQTESWKASMPGVRSSTEMTRAKESKAVMEQLIQRVGRDAVKADIDQHFSSSSSSQLERLKLANDCDITLERLEQELQAFEMTIQTHRLIVELQKRGKPVPASPDEMKLQMQTYSRHLLTKKEQKEMENKMKKMMKGHMRGQFSRNSMK